MYQGFRVFKRNPTFYNPRSAGMVFLAYYAYSCYHNAIQKSASNNFEDFQEPHPHTYEEKVRQFHDKTNANILSTVHQQRAELAQKLKQEATL